MARRTFSDAMEELKFRLGNRSDATASLREWWLNDAYLKIAKQYVHKELQVTTTLTQSNGSDSFATHSQLWWTEWIFNETAGRPLNIGDRDQIESMTKRTGTPLRFYWWGSNYVTDSIADRDYSHKVFFIQKPTRMSSPASDSLNFALSEEFDQLIIMWGAKIGLGSLRDLEEADAVGKEISLYVAQQKFALWEQSKNDQETGVQVRFR